MRRETAQDVRYGKKLGILFEDDYREKILELDWGQRKFAKRWESSKNAIFSRKAKSNWLVKLENMGILPKTDASVNSVSVSTRFDLCPICEKTVFDEYCCPDAAHWYSNHKGGNLTMKICKLCHGKMHNGDPLTIQKYLSTLLNNKEQWTEGDIGDIVKGISEHEKYLK